MTEIQIGSFVTIVRGPFKDYQGVVSQITNTNIVVELDIFGRKVPVPLQMEDFEATAAKLLEAAYKALKRDALASITILHQQHRNWINSFYTFD